MNEKGNKTVSTLHTVNNSPFENNSLKSCLDHMKAGDALLLIEDGVVGARRASAIADGVKKAMGDCKIYALGPDLAARGMNADTVIDGIELVDYGGFVDLAVQHERTQAWL